MSKHTQGPWKWEFIEGEEDELNALRGADDSEVLGAGWDYGHGFIYFKKREDLRLIAKAPEMYALLESLREKMNEYGELSGREAQGHADTIGELLRSIDGE